VLAILKNGFTVVVNYSIEAAAAEAVVRNIG
jgi:hypothetical protein